MELAQTAMKAEVKAFIHSSDQIIRPQKFGKVGRSSVSRFETKLQNHSKRIREFLMTILKKSFSNYRSMNEAPLSLLAYAAY